ncbi:hypothetical protein ABW20_dc0105889 [Dactylellina cionopaga]|nr:hypothetical protein ABW20_dc0105889 [Dactylellina cionopaga]
MSGTTANLNSILLRDSTVASPTDTTSSSIDLDLGSNKNLCFFSVYSTVMVFNPDFNFGTAVKCNTSGNDTFTSWFESDSEMSPLGIKAPSLMTIEELPLSPKSLPPPLPSVAPKMAAAAPSQPSVVPHKSNGADRVKVSTETNGSQSKSNRKVNIFPKRQPQTEVTEHPDQLRCCMLERNANDNSIREGAAGSSRAARKGPISGGSEIDDIINKNAYYECSSKSIINPTASPPYSSNNSSSTTIRPTEPHSPLEESPTIVVNSRKTRPKLQLQTATDSSSATSNAPSKTVRVKTNRRLSKSRPLTRGNKENSPPRAVSRSSLESDTSRRTEPVVQQNQAISKLPFHSLLLSPLGARSRNSILPPSTSVITTNSAESLRSHNSSSSSVLSSRSGTATEDIGEEEVAELPDMVSSSQFLGTAKEQPSGSSRSGSRLRRFSLAYLSGSEHDYDGGSEQSSTRSPLRSWRSWSNRSSMVSFSSSNNRNSRNRYSTASISTSQSSSLSSSGLDQHHTHTDAVGHVDDRHRPSLSSSSVAELSWRQVPPQTYAHLMSSRRNSVVTSTTTQHWQYSQMLTHTYSAAKAPSLNLSASRFSNSDASSVGSLVERVYIIPTPLNEKGEDPFTAFYMATKPKTTATALQDEELRAYEKQKKQEKMLARIANGSFFDSDDEDEDDDDEEEENQRVLTEIEEEDVFGHSNAADWWMSGIEEAPEEDEDWEIPRVPSLEFDVPFNRGSSISTGTTLTNDELSPSTPTAAEIAHYRKITEMAMSAPMEKRRRRRTASSECMIIDAAKGLKTMYLEDTPDECAVEEDEDGGVLGATGTGVLSLEPVKPLSIGSLLERVSR